MKPREYPHSVETERAFLGGLLTDPGQLEGVLWLSPDDLYRHDHRELWLLMRAMHHEGVPPDMINVPMRVGRLENADSVGGYAYVSDLPHHCPAASLVDSYAHSIARDAARRRLLAAIQATEASLYDGEASPEETLRLLDERLEAALAAPSGRGKSYEDVHAALSRVLERLRNPPERPTMVSTGFDELDEVILGLPAGKMVVVAAQTGGGKTSLALEMAYRVANAGTAALVCSTEMSAEECAARVVAAHSELREGIVHADRAHPRALAQLEDATAHTDGLELYVCDTAGITVGEIKRHARRLAAEAERSGGRLGLVVVDYLQRLGLPQGRDVTRSRVVGQAAQDLKNLAMDLGCCVLLLSQFSRGAANTKRPALHHLRDSGEIEQEADAVLLLHRDPDIGVLEVTAAKNRHGPQGTAFIGWDPDGNPAWRRLTHDAIRQVKRMMED